MRGFHGGLSEWSSLHAPPSLQSVDGSIRFALSVETRNATVAPIKCVVCVVVGSMPQLLLECTLRATTHNTHDW